MTDDAKLIERLLDRIAALEAGAVTAANQSPELIALAKYLAHLAGWETEPIPKKYQSEAASAIRAALYAAGWEIVARERRRDIGPSGPDPFGGRK